MVRGDAKPKAGVSGNEMLLQRPKGATRTAGNSTTALCSTRPSEKSMYCNKQCNNTRAHER